MAHDVHRPHDTLFRTVFGDPAEAAGLLRAYLPGPLAAELQWLLNVDQYRARREFPERDALIRVCDPASWELLGAMIQELIDAHPGSPFVHAGSRRGRRAGARRPA